jgi:hypothetical protein
MVAMDTALPIKKLTVEMVLTHKFYMSSVQPTKTYNIYFPFTL